MSNVFETDEELRESYFQWLVLSCVKHALDLGIEVMIKSFNRDNDSKTIDATLEIMRTQSPYRAVLEINDAKFIIMLSDDDIHKKIPAILCMRLTPMLIPKQLTDRESNLISSFLHLDSSDEQERLLAKHQFFKLVTT